MGAAVRELVPLYDCPAEATYFPSLTYTNMGSVKVQKAICVFEMDSGKPITRHSGFKVNEGGAVKGFVSVVRSVVTVGKSVSLLVKHSHCADDLVQL
jgi:primary-amine oxidase